MLAYINFLQRSIAFLVIAIDKHIVLLFNFEMK